MPSVFSGSSADRESRRRPPRNWHASGATLARTCAALLLVLLVAPAARAGTLVSFNFTNFGTVQVDLFAEVAPLQVANFLQYVNGDLYNDTIVHRSDVGLGVIQGGGYRPNSTAITPFAQVNNESWLHNTRGTIAMARSADVNSAKSQWFINTDDNTGTDQLGLPAGQGYTVFGWVVGGGMTVVDNIHAVPTFAYNPPFNQIPLQNFTQEDKNNGVNPTSHSIVLASADVISTHPTFQNPISRVDVNNDGLLTNLDSLVVVNSLISHEIHNVDPFESNPFAYRDINGDGLISPLDLVIVVNALIEHGTGGPAPLASMAEPSVSPLVVVPEPAAWVLVSWVVLAVAAACKLHVRRAVRTPS
jgi:cyclophilin family peptidyl-prolyl cis-trans isomerase